MADRDGFEEQDASSKDDDRLLVRPYIQRPLNQDAGYRLPESGSPATASAPGSAPPAASGPVSGSASEPAPEPASDPASQPAAGPLSEPTSELPDVPVDDDRATAVLPPVDGEPEPALTRRERRQVLWLVGAGVATALAVVIGIVTLWPRGDDPPASVAAPPGGVNWPVDGEPSASGPAAARPSSAPATAASRPAGPPATRVPSAPPSVAGSSPAAPPPSATLAPPPAADRVGPITGAGGLCLDVGAGIALPGSPATVRACNGTLSQRWTVAADGTLRAGGSCATAAESGQVSLGVCGDAAAGQWRAGPAGSVVNSGSGQCLTDPADGADPGARVRTAACGGSGQRWALP